MTLGLTEGAALTILGLLAIALLAAAGAVAWWVARGRWRP